MDVALLRALSEAPGVSGREEAVRAVLRAYLEGHADEVATDPLGNLLVRKGRGPVRVLLDAHIDEVGFLVSGFTEDGLLRFKTVGGIDDRVVPGRAVWIGPNRVPGVIGLKAIHLTGGERDKAVPVRDLFIDIGARSRDEAESVVDYGDPVVWATEFEEWGGAVVKGKALDDRAGCALLAEAVRDWSGGSRVTLLASFSAQEEIGLRGARVAAERLKPHVALALEATSCADVPGVPPEESVTRFGQGPALSWLDGTNIVPERLRAHLEALASRAGIPLQHRRLATAGTDAGAIHLTGAGVPTAVMALPARYIHSAASLVHKSDYDHALALVRLFLDSLERGEFKP
ncbi:M42 family metallopeptidase [Caldinitratiruptor microaerophilus]|uniref:Aminopeptidase n=1 Tax=Caldinitratiruptor microaerophilus TaxID=671077 RepID=A0AA35CHT0_9FIRM|nr:M42 family metallopeptidase [Caldinitratiruptor microaerophilus]BDG59152.1 aminopeptidase [Caldinitratiruptor microaerophilus]